MEDVQNQKALVEKEIERVGIKGLTYPIILVMRCSGDAEIKKENISAEVDMYVTLPKEFRGTHMSRFVELLHEEHTSLDPHDLETITWRLLDRLHSIKAEISLRFTLFICKKAPVTGIQSFMSYECMFTCVQALLGKPVSKIQVKVPIMSVCPCSVEISDFGAHNQRCNVTVDVEVDKSKGILWLEDLIEAVEKCGSSPLYSVLKRPDEKFITEMSYLKPVFVEDIARNVAKILDTFVNIIQYEIKVESEESIHNHQAYAYIKEDRGSYAHKRST